MNEYDALVEWYWYWQGRENWHSATLTTTNPTRTFLDGGISVTNRLELWVGYRDLKGVHHSFPLMLVCIGGVCTSYRRDGCRLDFRILTPGRCLGICLSSLQDGCGARLVESYYELFLCR